MTNINEGLPPNDLRLFLRTISLATPEQVIRLGRESADHIDALETRVAELEAKFKRMALDCLSAHGQAMDAYQAQIEAEAKLDEAADTINAQAAMIKALMEALERIAYASDVYGVEANAEDQGADRLAYAHRSICNLARAAIAAVKETA